MASNVHLIGPPKLEVLGPISFPFAFNVHGPYSVRCFIFANFDCLGVDDQAFFLATLQMKRQQRKRIGPLSLFSYGYWKRLLVGPLTKYTSISLLCSLLGVE